MEIPDTPHRFDLCVKISCEGLCDRGAGSGAVRPCSRWSLCALTRSLPGAFAPGTPGAGDGGRRLPARVSGRSHRGPACIALPGSPCVGSGSRLLIGTQRYNRPHSPNTHFFLVTFCFMEKPRRSPDLECILASLQEARVFIT